jgi:hypothetical protein
MLLLGRARASVISVYVSRSSNAFILNTLRGCLETKDVDRN